MKILIMFPAHGATYRTTVSKSDRTIAFGVNKDDFSFLGLK